MTKQFTFEDVRNLRRGTAANEQYLFPYTEVPVFIRVLAQNEIIRAVNKGRTKAQEELTNPDQIETQDFQTRELLHVACRSKDDNGDMQPFFSTPDEVGELSQDEIAMLLEHYNEVQEKYAPLQSLEKPEDFDKLISELKKKSLIGMSLSSHTLRKLCLFLIDDGMTLLKDSGYGSSPASASSENTKTPPSGKQLGIKLQEPSEGKSS